MPKQNISAIKIAAVYIGTVVGAGFATGQEILQFFVFFGRWGLWGILLSTALFVLFGVLTMKLGLALAATSHIEIINICGGKGFRVVMDALIMLSLFGALTAMMAGTGALFEQQFGLTPALGNLLMGILTAITVLAGLRGVIRAISAVVPFLLVSVLAISIFTLIHGAGGNAATAAAEMRGGHGLMGNWFTAALLYASYNIILSVSVLAPLGGTARQERTVLWGGALGGLGLGAASMMIYFALSAGNANGANIIELEVPLLYLAGQIAPLAAAGFVIVLLAEVYTTAVSALYGFSARLNDDKRGKHRTRYVIIGTSIAAFFASLFGFSNLVRYLYPLQGYGGFLLLAALLYAKLKEKEWAKRRCL